MLMREWRYGVLCAFGFVASTGAAGCGHSSDGSSGSQEAREAPAAVPGACEQVAPDGIGGVLDVADYGAKTDGSDAYPGLQSAIDAACSSAVPPAVYLRAGQYSISRPLSIRCDHFEMLGACRNGVTLKPNFSGPAVVVTPVGQAIPKGPALVGAGHAAVTKGIDWHLDLRDIPAVELNGKTAFTAEAFVALSENLPGSSYIAQSHGCSGPAAFPCNRSGGAFTLGVVSTGNSKPYLSAAVTVGGRQVLLGGPNGSASNLCAPSVADANAVSLNDAHHVAVTYDGAMVRLFLDGKSVSCKAASGPIDQQTDETVSVGPYWGGFDSNPIAQPIAGRIDAVRLSDAPRYTSDFAKPAAALENDGETLALVDFEDLPAPPAAPAGQPALTNPTSLTMAGSRGQSFWLPIRSSNTAAEGVVKGVRLHDFTIDGGMGLFSYRMIGSRLWHLRCLGCDYGFATMGSSQVSSYEDLEATAGTGRSRYGLVSSGADGNTFHDIRLSGQTLPFLVAWGSQNVMTNVTITPSRTATVYGMVLWYDSAILNGLTIDASGESPVWRGAVASITPWSNLQIQRGQIGNMRNPNYPATPIVLQRLKDAAGSPAALIQGTSFTGTASAPQIVHVVDAAANPKRKPTVILGATKDSDVPWSDDPVAISLPSDPSDVPDPRGLPQAMSGSGPVRGVVRASSVFDVTKYGAIADGTTDSYAAIQKAVDAACSANSAKSRDATVFFPIGSKSYVVRKPVLVHCDGLHIEGAQRSRSVIATQSGGGPALVLAPAGMTGLDVGRPLIGSGNAMKTNGDSYWLDLRDTAPAGELDGLTAFTAEAIVALDAPTRGYGGILQSHGCLGSGGVLPGCTSAFELGAFGRALVASLTVGSTRHELRGPELQLGTSYHAALTYDGQTIRLFVSPLVRGAEGGGKTEPVASVAATGAIAQGPHEHVTVGPRISDFDGRADDPAITGVIDSVRLSKAALYTAAYAPPSSELAPDPATTLVLLDFNEHASHGKNGAYATAGYVGGLSGPAWFPVRRASEPNGCTEPKLKGIFLHELTIDGGAGLFAMNAVSARYSALAVRSSTFGMVLAGDSSGGAFDDIRIDAATARVGLLVANGSGNVYHHLRSGRAKLPLVVAGGSGQQFSDVFIDTKGAVYGSVFVSAGVTIEGLYDYSNMDHPARKGSLVIVHPTSPFQLFKGELDYANQVDARLDGQLAQPIPVIVDGGEGVRFVGTSFGTGSTHCGADRQSPCPTFPAELIHVNSRSRRPNTVIGVTWKDPRVLLSNDQNLQSIGNESIGN